MLDKIKQKLNGYAPLAQNWEDKFHDGLFDYVARNISMGTFAEYLLLMDVWNNYHPEMDDRLDFEDTLAFRIGELRRIHGDIA